PAARDGYRGARRRAAGAGRAHGDRSGACRRRRDPRRDRGAWPQAGHGRDGSGQVDVGDGGGMRLRALAVGLAAAVAVSSSTLAAAAFASGSATKGPRLTVFGAASLTNVFPKIDPHARYSFGGSNMLAAQIQQGLPADVFASANTKLPAQ